MGSFWSYLYPKKEDIQNQLIDVMPEINANDISATTEEIKAMASSVSKNKTTWQEWFNILPEGKKHLAQLGQQMEGQIITTEGVVKANQQARASALAHNEAIKAQTFSAKAGKVALQALAMAGNMILFAAISKGIELVVKGFDNWIHRVEKANEAMNEAVGEYESAKSSLESVNSELEEQNKQIDELLAKDKLTYAEKGQLEELQAITKELLLQQDIEEKRAANASKEAADKAVDAYEKQYGKYDKTEEDLQQKLSYENFPIPEDADDVLGMIAAYIRAQELLEESQKEFDDAVKNGEDTTWLADDVQFNIDMVNDYRQALDENISDLQEKRLALEDEYNKAIEKRENGVEPLTSSEKDVIATYESIYDVMRMVYEYTDKNTWKSMQIESVFDTEGIEKTKEELIEMVKAGEFDESTLQSYPKLSEALKQNKISASELRNELEALADAESNVQSSTSNTENPISLSISDTIDQLNTKLKPAFDSLKSAYQNIFTDDGEFALNTIDILSTCDTIKSKLDEMSDLEGLNLDVDYSAYENFVRVLSDTQSTSDDVDKAFDYLANSITQAALSGAEDFETMKAALEDLGVVNNEMVAFDNLIRKTNALSDAGIDLAKATETQMEKFVDESVSAEYAGEALSLLHLKKTLANQETITTASDCQNILDLATAANIGTAYLEQLNTLMNLITKRDAAHASGDSRAVSELNRAISDFSANIVNNLNIDGLQVDFSGLGKGAESAGKNAGKSYKDALKEELSDLDSVISGITGRIDDQISTINEQKSAALDAIDTEKEALEEAKDAAVEALEAERDARLEVIETQKEQLEEQIELIDKQIEQKQDEIDAINDAADARKRELDLQRAQYELERMQNQRTMLVYSSEKGMHYEADTSGIRDAKEAVDEARRQIEIANIQKEIDLLEDQKDILNEQIDLLDERTDAVNEYYDNLIRQTEKYYDSQIAVLEKQRKSTEADFESLIENLENSKSKYQELTEILEKAELSAKISQLGLDEEALLNGSEEEFRKLKDAYMNIVFQLNEGNGEVLNRLRELSGYDGAAPAILSDSAQKLNEMNNMLDTSGQGIGALNSSLAEIETATGNAASNVGSLTANLSEISGPLTEEQTSFCNLKEKIDGVISSITEKASVIQEAQQIVGGTVSSEMADFLLLKEKIDAVQQSIGSIGNAINQLDSSAILKLLDAFQLLYNKLALISITLGAGIEGAEEGAAGGIASVIQSLNKISMEEGIIKQLTILKNAIDSVISAISGGGTSRGSALGSSDQVKGSGTGGGKGGLVGAMDDFKSAADKALGGSGGSGENADGKGSEGGGTGAIGRFEQLKTAVDNVTASIGSEMVEGAEDETSHTLISSIDDLGTSAEDTLGESGGKGVIGKFETFRDVIKAASDHVAGIKKGLIDLNEQKATCTIYVNIIRTESGGGGGDSAAGESQLLGSINLNSAAYNASYNGNAHYEGTAKLTGDWGVRNAGRTLVGELGQEIVVRGSRFFTVGDNGAEFVNLQKGDIVFNHLQTKELLSKGSYVGRGKALVSGTALPKATDPEGRFTLPDGHMARPLQPGDRGYDLMKAFEPLVEKIKNGQEKILNNAMFEGQKKFEKWAKEVTNATAIHNVTNNRNVQKPVYQTFNITMPNVTDSTSAAALMNDLQSLSAKKYQVDW